MNESTTLTLNREDRPKTPAVVWESPLNEYGVKYRIVVDGNTALFETWAEDAMKVKRWVSMDGNEVVKQLLMDLTAKALAG